MKLRLLVAALVAATSSQAFATAIIARHIAAGTDASVSGFHDPHLSSLSLGGLNSATVSTSSAVHDNEGSTVDASLSVDATWLSADAGKVNLAWGWTVVGPGIAETNRAPENWSYDFTASQNGKFNIGGTVTSTGSGFGLQPIYLLGDASGTIGGDVFNPSGTSSHSFNLLAGQTYHFALYNFGNVSGGSIAGNAQAAIDWNIRYAGVPEPASWAFMIAGFGATGAAMRRRRARPMQTA